MIQRKKQAMMLVLSTTFFFMILTVSSAVDTLAVNQRIRDGETIVSENENFELGFFSPGSSKKRYLGIWYKKASKTVVWVANRETPLDSATAVFLFDYERVMLLVVDNGSITWSSNFSVPTKDRNPVAQLLDTGNFVIKGSYTTEENYIWQSFDYPGNTLLPGMKIGKSLVTGKERHLTSWRSSDDPSPGNYTIRVIMDVYPQEYLMKGSMIEARMGPWNGHMHAGLPDYKPNPAYAFTAEIIVNQEEVYHSYMYSSTTYLESATLTEDGRYVFRHLNTRKREWVKDLTVPLDICDSYGLCGPNGFCDTVSIPSCGCLDGFEPRHLEERIADYWVSGCQRMRALNCSPNEGFLKFSGVKLPDTLGARFKEGMSLGDCEAACKNNCSCTAYANPYFTEHRSGCLLFVGDLIDVRVYPQNGQDLYVRVAATELLDLQSGPNGKKQLKIIVSLSTSSVIVVLSLILGLYAWSKRKRRPDVEREGTLMELLGNHKDSSEKGDIELSLFCLPELSRATNNFSIDNQLGEGGFGPVYKGVLKEGHEIAVKRLSKCSQQGLDEFKNEITCIAKLQHRNLVKLLGYCIQGEETMLIYEYLPNKSLDRFLFDDSMKSLLDWPQRFHIINGITRGLLYLHQDSRLRVVHRDLKAGNILLDYDMTPKISDFGLARMFREHEKEANTNKVVGTLGYISPEYAVNGHFSVKSDIFSFGVLVLEIVSGKKNREFSHEGHHDNLLGHAWRLYKEGKGLDLVDSSLRKTWIASEVLRTLHVGLLCVQKRAEDRPIMSSVLLMLSGEGSLPPPKQPGFFIEESSFRSITSPSSINDVTVTQLDVR